MSDELLLLGFELITENSPSETVSFVTSVTLVFGSLSLANRGHDGDVNLHSKLPM